MLKSMSKSRHTTFTAHLSVRFPQSVMDRLDAIAGPYGRTDFVRHLILNAIEDAEGVSVKPAGRPSKAKTPDPQRPWHDTCGWEFMRDVFYDYLPTVGCDPREQERGQDNPDDAWKAYYASGTYLAVLDAIEPFAQRRLEAL